MKKTTLLALFAAALVATSTSAVHATNLYTTNFNTPTYSDNPIIGQDGWLITGTSIVSPILVANTATNGNVTLATTGQDVNRPFTPAQTSGSVFLSADINVASANATGDYFIHLGDGTTTNFYARTYVKTGTTGYVMALGTSSGAAVTYGTTELAFGTTYHMVAQYDFVAAGTTNDTATLFINPSDPIFGGGTPYVAGTTTGTDATTISTVNFRQGTTTPVVTIDNVNVAIVPEPASFVLGGLGLIGLIGIARRRSA